MLGQTLSKEKLIPFSGSSLQREDDGCRPRVPQKAEFLLLLLAVKFLTRTPEGTGSAQSIPVKKEGPHFVCGHLLQLPAKGMQHLQGTGQPWGVKQHRAAGSWRTAPRTPFPPKAFPSHSPRLYRNGHHLPEIRTGGCEAQHLLQQPPVPLHPLGQREPLPALCCGGGHRQTPLVLRRSSCLFFQGGSLVGGGRAARPAALIPGELGDSRHVSLGCRHPPEPRGAGAGCRGLGATGHRLPPIQQPIRQVGAELSPRLRRCRVRSRLPPPGPGLLG